MRLWRCMPATNRCGGACRCLGWCGRRIYRSSGVGSPASASRAAAGARPIGGAPECLRSNRSSASLHRAGGGSVGHDAALAAAAGPQGTPPVPTGSHRLAPVWTGADCEEADRRPSRSGWAVGSGGTDLVRCLDWRLSPTGRTMLGFIQSAREGGTPPSGAVPANQLAGRAQVVLVSMNCEGGEAARPDRPIGRARPETHRGHGPRDAEASGTTRGPGEGSPGRLMHGQSRKSSACRP